MSSKSVFCFASSRTQAGRILERLKAARFSNHEISALFADQRTSFNFADARHTQASGVAVVGAGILGILGGVLGWTAGMGVLAIPGVGTFFDAGPGLAALGGVAVGAVLGAAAGGFLCLVLPELEGKRQDDKLRNGGIRISVLADNDAEITQAEVIFADAGGQGICTAAVVAESEDDRPTEILTYARAR